MVHPRHTLTLLQHLTMTSEIFSKILQYFPKTPPETLQQHNGTQIAIPHKRIQCMICINQERTTLLLICKHLLTYRECLLRCHNRFPLCRIVTTQIISVLWQITAFSLKNHNNERIGTVRKFGILLVES